MPKGPTIHWNPPDNTYPQFIGKTRCGEALRVVKWRRDTSDVTCNNCQKLIKQDDGQDEG